MLFDLGGIPDIETPDEYANRKVSELWIKKHKRIWNKWRDKYLWNHYIADEVKYLSFVMLIIINCGSCEIGKNGVCGLKKNFCYGNLLLKKLIFSFYGS